MDFEKYCENLTDKLTDIMQHKAPTLLRNAELCVNPHYLDHERHHITFYGYFKIEDKNYQFFHLRVDIGSKVVCIQRLAVSPHLRRLGIGSCIINTLAEFAYADGEGVSAFVGGYDFMDSGLDDLLGESPKEEVDNIAFWESLGFAKSDDLLDMGRDDYYIKADSVQV